MRLIDADELMEHSGWYNLATGKSIHGVQDFEIASMPTIDAVSIEQYKDLYQKYYDECMSKKKEARHGTWKLKMVGAFGDLKQYSCSECGFSLLLNPTKIPPYCEDCGTKMDKEK